MKYLKICFVLSLFFVLTGCSVCGTGAIDELARGFKSEGASCTSSSVSITVTKPSSNRTIWVDDESSKRTVSFSHTGTSISCSRDGGSTYSSCDSDTSLIWLTTDYSQKHIIKSVSSSGTSETYEFTPSTDYPGLSFVTCTSEVSSDSLFGAFTTSYLGAASKVICMTDGVSITNVSTETAMLVGADDITIIAREGETATFSTTRNSGSGEQQSVFTVSGRTGIKFVGLTMTSITGAASWLVRTDSSSEDVQILDSVLTNANASGAFYSVYVLGTSGNTTPIVVKRSTITMDEAKIGVFVSSGTASISDSVITSKYRGVHVSISSTATIANTTVSCASTDATDYPIYNFRGTLNLSNSTVNDGCGNGAVVINDNNVSATVANLEGNTIKRTTNATGNTAAGLVALNGGSSNQFNSASNQNRVCNDAGSTEDFTATSSGTFAGSWSDANQLNSGVLADCL